MPLGTRGSPSRKLEFVPSVPKRSAWGSPRKDWTEASTSAGRSRRSSVRTSTVRSGKRASARWIDVEYERQKSAAISGDARRGRGIAGASRRSASQAPVGTHVVVRVADREDEPRVRKPGGDAREPVHVLRGLLDHPRLRLACGHRRRDGGEDVPGRTGGCRLADRVVDEHRVLAGLPGRVAAVRVGGRGLPVLLALNGADALELLGAVRAVGARGDVQPAVEARFAEDRHLGMPAQGAPQPRAPLRGIPTMKSRGGASGLIGPAAARPRGLRRRLPSAAGGR